MGRLTFFVGALAVLRLVGYFTDPILTRTQIHRVVGEPERVAGAEAPSSLRVVTWNIQRGIHLGDITAQLRGMNADVVLLQEADIACRRSDYRHVPRELGHALNMNWVAAGEFQEIGESSRGVPALTAQAILSRYPISAVSTIRFKNQAMLRWTLSPVQPRRGGRIALKAQTAGVQLYNTHIESGGNETLRARQIRQILDDHEQRRTDGTRAIIAGDFNNGPQSKSPMFRALGEVGFENALKATALARTSAGNKHPIDWIFVRGLTADGHVLDTGRASDHFAVIADVTLTALRRDVRERSPRTETTRTR
jgi:endonuclease/exonuclease/phosphatase family metal-dependent hydrolase